MSLKHRLAFFLFAGYSVALPLFGFWIHPKTVQTVRVSNIMAFSAESGALQATPSAPKAYNGGALSLIPGNNTVAVNIAVSPAGAPGTTANGVYRISRATVTTGTIGAYAVLGTVPAVYNSAGGSNVYQPAVYNDASAVNGSGYAYTVALDNNA